MTSTINKKFAIMEKTMEKKITNMSDEQNKKINTTLQQLDERFDEKLVANNKVLAEQIFSMFRNPPGDSVE